MDVAKFLAEGGSAVAAWFIVVIEAGVIAYMYKNTYPKEVVKDNQSDILENQKKIIEGSDRNTTTLAMILEILKSFIPRG